MIKIRMANKIIVNKKILHLPIPMMKSSQGKQCKEALHNIINRLLQQLDLMLITKKMMPTIKVAVLENKKLWTKI